MQRANFLTIDGRPAVQFELDLDYSAQRVWEAVTDTQQLQQWFPSTLTFDPFVGGVVDFSGDPEIKDLKGIVLKLEAQRALGFTWGDNELRFSVEMLTLSRTRFRLSNLLGSRKEAARNAAGWQVCLGQLEVLLSQGHADGPHGDAGAHWQQIYEAYVAAGFPHGVQIPE
ncbi:MAG: SRPBCC domain-containing protein [Actinomycetota bacterium]|nr:SRPBCC domain-containing protein [Actinomycetota bacterium]MDP2289462.1 SRPBCC domain-containing protein [Actinomycetota bacterium]